MPVSLPVASLGQTDVRALQDAIKGKQLGLRSYSADEVTHYKWANGGLLAGEIKLHGLEVFTDDSVKLKGGKIVLQGKQETMVRNGTDVARAGRSPMTLEVDLQGADLAVVIPQLQNLLFYLDLDTGIAGLPKLVANMLPYPIKGSAKPSDNCTLTTQDGRVPCSTTAKSIAKITGPKIVSMGEPEFSQEARDAKVSGIVKLLARITDKGKVEDIWLLTPLGYGLDENAANAYRQEVLSPRRWMASLLKYS